MSDPENTETPSMGVTIIGDSLKCVHGIDTLDINEWNEHCSDPANGHTEEGTTRCITCNRLLEFSGIPYRPITPAGKDLKIRCHECAEFLDSEYEPDPNVTITKLPEPKKPEEEEA